MLNIASSQAEAGDVNGSRNTLRTLVSKYPEQPRRRAGEAAAREEVGPEGSTPLSARAGAGEPTRYFGVPRE